jgi:hypothetical protein
VPSIEVRLAERPLRVLLDTGASQHFVLGVAARAHGVRSWPFGGGAEDGYGAPVAVRQADGAALTLPGYVATYLFVVDVPTLARHGLFGAVAPQLLAPRGHAVLLDLPRRVVEVRPLDALASWARDADARACPAGPDRRDGWRYVAPVEIGDATLPLLVDTGATGTLLDVEAATEAGLVDGFALGAPVDEPGDEPGNDTGNDTGTDAGHDAREDTVETHSASSSIEVRVVDDVPVRVGGAELRVAAGVGDRGNPTRQCGTRGVLGYDVLRRCVLVLRHDGAAMRCR